MSEVDKLSDLFALSEEDLLYLAHRQLPGARLRAEPERGIWSFLYSLSTETRKRLCAVLSQIDVGDVSNVQGAALIADTIAAASGHLTPFALAVYVVSRGREQLCRGLSG